MASLATTIVFALLTSRARAESQVPLWGQCGGIGYTGSTDCTTSAICTSYNPYYFQCIPGITIPTSSVPNKPSSTITSVTLTTLSTTTTSKSSSFPSSTSSAPGSVITGTKYLITFGDSYSQTGFDVTSTKPSAANPLGNPTLPGWTASGGLNWVGFLVSQLNTSLTLSYNFAYGGATTDASLVQPYTSTVLSFVDQVSQFSSSIASHPSYAPWTAANTLVGVWMGVNDVGNSYWLANETTLLGQIMDRYFEQLQILYDAGARDFVLLSVPPITKTPMMVQQSADARATEDKVIAQYNALLAARLASFSSANSGVTGKVVDTSVPFNTAIANPTAYGAPDATCYNSDGTSCLWFNDYHPGIAINKLVAQAVADAWKGSFF
ncbi:Carbohydrate esterase family 16 protein [Pleurostoma richardsiae]|uniref:Carbohydrate esterase family 16 protein n=1 Tax=Pleurostoma richardsiae TaxID=41990 RepID=A0AA38RIU7_9PEZI|nr:Carbohydrate esterase family 16 protein [Pleurostoma richardsiae]